MERRLAQEAELRSVLEEEGHCFLKAVELKPLSSPGPLDTFNMVRVNELAGGPGISVVLAKLPLLLWVAEARPELHRAAGGRGGTDDVEAAA
ncbi:MAG: hypothetical protein JWN48_2890 [Myxococcaceae bacterium]|nr:hypothetical protein [Myxococcaceae bacterium]